MPHESISIIGRIANPPGMELCAMLHLLQAYKIKNFLTKKLLSTKNFNLVFNFIVSCALLRGSTQNLMMHITTSQGIFQLDYDKQK